MIIKKYLYLYKKKRINNLLLSYGIKNHYQYKGPDISRKI